MAPKANIVIDQGSTFETVITLTSETNLELNIENHTFRGQIRKHFTSSNAYNFTITKITPYTAGIISIGLDANTTSSMEMGRYMYDVEMVSPGGNVTRIVEGIATVTPEVTR